MTEVELLRAYGVDPQEWSQATNADRQTTLLLQTLAARRDVSELMARMDHYYPIPQTWALDHEAVLEGEPMEQDPTQLRVEAALREYREGLQQ